jgi:hypothetical protein
MQLRKKHLADITVDGFDKVSLRGFMENVVIDPFRRDENIGFTRAADAGHFARAPLMPVDTLTFEAPVVPSPLFHFIAHGPGKVSTGLHERGFLIPGDVRQHRAILDQVIEDIDNRLDLGLCIFWFRDGLSRVNGKGLSF